MDERKNLNRAVRVILKEARELLRHSGLDAENDIAGMLKTAEIIINSNDLSDDLYNELYLAKDDITDQLVHLYHEKLRKSFNF